MTIRCTPARLTAITAAAISSAALASDAVPLSLGGERGQGRRLITNLTLRSLPADEQRQLRLEDPAAAWPVEAIGVVPLEPTDERYETIAHLVSPEDFARLRDVHVNILVGLVTDPIGAPMCLAPGSDPALIAAINNFYASMLNGGDDAARFQQTGRWTQTASQLGGFSQGDPTFLTYSFVPDGTFVPARSGQPSGNSNLFQWLNGIYGSQAIWTQIFADSFDRWASLTGNTYQFEPNDDGVRLSSQNRGVLGTRGDVRIAAIALDGNFNTLAYNAFPNDGDMVFDSSDSFFNSTFSNSIRLRNVIMHEHGHGMGMLHVCPINETKLMEPTFSDNYFGPQIDDIQNGQRHYGDALEPNDNISDATLLGTFGIGGLRFRNTVSVDDNGDVDFYEFTITEPGAVTITATPAAGSYLDGPQNGDGSCSPGTEVNFGARNDLILEIRDPSGALIIQSNTTGAGSVEALTFDLNIAQTYYAVVRGGANNRLQMYDIQVTLAPPTIIPADIAFVSPPPPLAQPGTSQPITIELTANEETFTSVPTLELRVDGEAEYESFLATEVNGDQYTFVIPPLRCPEGAVYFFTVEASATGTVTLPVAGDLGPARIDTSPGPGLLFQDNFSSDTGWTVTGNIATQSAGRWERGDPLGAFDARVADPGDDFDGGGECFVTGNASGNFDVDGGQTILNSPVFDLSGATTATVTYARWFDNNDGGTATNSFQEVFIVEVSNDGGMTWSNLETVGPTGDEVSGGWILASYQIEDVVPLTDQIRVRFIAQDTVNSVIEAGVDAFSIVGDNCPDCPLDLASPETLDIPDGLLDSSDLEAFLLFAEGGDPAADLTGPTPGTPEGTIDFFDTLFYLEQFDTGCPGDGFAN